MTKEEVKAAVRARDGQRCVDCGMTAEEHRRRYKRTLDVHRKTPGSAYSIEGCETVCKPCHKTRPKSERGSVVRTTRMVGLPSEIASALEVIAEENMEKLTPLVVRICLAFAKEKGRWPPQGRRPKP